MSQIELGKLVVAIPDSQELIGLRGEVMMIKNDLYDLGLDVEQLKKEIVELRKAQPPTKKGK